VEKVWLIPNQYLMNKVKKVYEFMHRIYPLNQYFIKFKSDIDVVNCTFCDSCPETGSFIMALPICKTNLQNVCDFYHKKL